MANEINLTSQKWNDIIFEGKNKDYGAYEMRTSSSKRHIAALLVILAFVVFVSFLPLIVKTITPTRSIDNLDGETVLADLQKALEEQVKAKDIIREAAAPPTPKLKATIQFTVPEIATKEDITDDNSLIAQDDLAQSSAQVSVATVLGDKEGVDIQDLEGQKVIAEDLNQVYDFVEQEPVFPGGPSALNKYLSKTLNYPEIAAQSRIQGKVIVQFVVSETGAITDVQVLGGVNDRSLQAEAIRVVKGMPKWIPGRQNGQPVKVRYNVPIQFKLNENF